MNIFVNVCHELQIRENSRKLTRTAENPFGEYRRILGTSVQQGIHLDIQRSPGDLQRSRTSSIAV
eukprot:1382601-Amorphochlora_amoeboformis.AAC.2